jgi:hypothetical protein
MQTTMRSNALGENWDGLTHASVGRGGDNSEPRMLLVAVRSA